MAKGIGLIGNFSGKVGNTVGYQLSASNNGQTQGVRVYQPNVKNPKTAAQAEQRAKLAPINATYRALKSIIDRGNEGLPYGNKSRLAWLKQAFKAENMPWIEKGTSIEYAVGCQLTKGSLTSLNYTLDESAINIAVPGIEGGTSLATVGALSTALLAGIPQLKAGDQITFLTSISEDNLMNYEIISFVLDPTSTAAIAGFTSAADTVVYDKGQNFGAYSVIVSRMGANGEHLRSNEKLNIKATITAKAPYDTTSKTAAIKSYMKQAGAEGDWAEESLQD